MNRAPLLLALLAPFLTGGVARADDPVPSPAPASPAPRAVDLQNTKCPTCGGPVKPGVTETVGGRTVHFCSRECAEKYRAGPKAYEAALRSEPAVAARMDAAAAAIARAGSPPSAESEIASWPDKPREVARKIMEKYGPPAEVTASQLLWNATGPWKRTIVYRDEVPHSFPKPHTDVVEQFVDYRVPPAKFSDLAAYDGSVIVERTKGEMSARCDKEEMNFLALNLADEIVRGKKTAEEARTFYAQTVKAFMEGKTSPYTQGLMFHPSPATADPDQPSPLLAK